MDREGISKENRGVNFALKCRLCVKKQPLNSLRVLKEDSDSTLSLIEGFLGVKIEFDLRYLKYVCCRCLNMIKGAERFKQACLANLKAEPSKVIATPHAKTLKILDVTQRRSTDRVAASSDGDETPATTINPVKAIRVTIDDCTLEPKTDLAEFSLALIKQPSRNSSCSKRPPLNIPAESADSFEMEPEHVLFDVIDENEESDMSVDLGSNDGLPEADASKNVQTPPLKKCTKCLIEFATLSAYANHLGRENTCTVLERRSSVKVTPASLKMIRTCSTCKVEFSTVQEYWKHLRTAHLGKPRIPNQLKQTGQGTQSTIKKDRKRLLENAAPAAKAKKTGATNPIEPDEESKLEPAFQNYSRTRMRYRETCSVCRTEFVSFIEYLNHVCKK